MSYSLLIEGSTECCLFETRVTDDSLLLGCTFYHLVLYQLARYSIFNFSSQNKIS